MAPEVGSSLPPSPVLAEVLGAYACRLACKVLWQAAQYLLHHGQVLEVVVRLEQRITCRVQARVAEAASVARSIKSYVSPRLCMVTVGCSY